MKKNETVLRGKSSGTDVYVFPYCWLALALQKLDQTVALYPLITHVFIVKYCEVSMMLDWLIKTETTIYIVVSDKSYHMTLKFARQVGREIAMRFDDEHKISLYPGSMIAKDKSLYRSLNYKWVWLYIVIIIVHLNTNYDEDSRHPNKAVSWSVFCLYLSKIATSEENVVYVTFSLIYSDLSQT